MKIGKKILISSLVATSILVANTPSIKSNLLNQVEAKKETLNSFDIDFTKMGLAVTAIKMDKDIDSYLVKIVEPDRFLEWILNKIAPQEFIKIKDKNEVLDKLNGTHFMMDINRRLFKESKEDSIHIYPYIGSSDSASILKLLARNKKGIYLTIDKKRGYFKGRLESINYTLKGSEQKYILWSGAGFECTKNSALKSCDIRGGKLSLGQKGGSNPLNIQFEGLKCSYNIDNNFIGSKECIFPKVRILQTDSKSSNKLVIDGFKFNNIVTIDKDNSSLINSKNSLELNSILLDTLGNRSSSKILVKDFKLSVIANGLNFEAYKKLYLLINELNQNRKVNSNELKSAIIPLVAEGSRYIAKLHLGVANVKDIFDDETTEGSINNWRANYELELDKIIRYEEKNLIDKIDYSYITQTSNSSWEAKGVVLNYGIGRLYNPIPKSLDIILDIASNPQDDTSKYEPQLDDIFNKILNSGLEAHISPINIKEITSYSNGAIDKFGPILLDLRANLKPNKIDKNNPMAPMMFLGKFLANGELRLREKDFNAILPLIPSDFSKMIDALAKKENGEVVFKIRFENGALVVNGVPIPLI